MCVRAAGCGLRAVCSPQPAVLSPTAPQQQQIQAGGSVSLYLHTKFPAEVQQSARRATSFPRVGDGLCAAGFCPAAVRILLQHLKHKFHKRCVKPGPAARPGLRDAVIVHWAFVCMCVCVCVCVQWVIIQPSPPPPPAPPAPPAPPQGSTVKFAADPEPCGAGGGSARVSLTHSPLEHSQKAVRGVRAPADLLSLSLSPSLSLSLSLPLSLPLSLSLRSGLLGTNRQDDVKLQQQHLLPVSK